MTPRRASRGRPIARPTSRGVNRGGDIRKGVPLIAFAVLLTVGLFGAYAYVASSRVEVDPNTGCPTNGPSAMTAILFDRTDPINEKQRLFLTNKLDALRESTKKFEEVDTYSLEDQGDNVVRLLQRICDPGRGADVSSLTGNPKLVQERWEKQFETPLREMLEDRLQGGGAKTSAIFEAVQSCLHQMRDDPLELEREARFELSEAVARLRAEIDLAVREFNHFNRTLQQSAQEAIEAQGNVALEALDKSTKQYADVAVQAARYLEGCFTEFNKQVAELNTNTAQITGALTALSTRIDAIEAPRDLLSQKLAPVFQRIAEAAEQTAGRASSERQRNQNVATLAVRIEALAGSIEGIFDRVTEKEQQVTTAIQHAVTAAGNATELTRQVRQWTQRFTDIESKQAEIAQALVDSSQAAQQRDATVDESMRKAFADATAAMGQYGTRVQTMLQTHAESFELELKHAESAFRSLSRVLTDGASLLANELGRRG